MLKKKLLLAACSGLTAGVILGFPNTAQAWWVRYSGMECQYAFPDADAHVGSTFYGDYGMQGSGDVICPVPDASNHSKVDIVTANIELGFYPGSTAKPCYADWDGEYGACDSPTAASADASHYRITLGDGNGFWDTDDGADFGFVVVALNDVEARISGLYYAH